MAKDNKTKKKKDYSDGKLPRTLIDVNFQSGNRVSLSRDMERAAMQPGKRVSKEGNIYWETRKNRSDKKGQRI